MFTFRTIFGAVALAGILASCAPPPPEPIAPEPTYNKYGEAIVASCRPSNQAISATHPDWLPICEPEGCRPGTEPTGAFSAPNVPICRPIKDDGPNGRQPATGGNFISAP